MNKVIKFWDSVPRVIYGIGSDQINIRNPLDLKTTETVDAKEKLLSCSGRL